MARHGVGGLVFVGLMFLGAGVGLLVGHAGAGVLIGMGLGFVAMALLDWALKRKAPKLRLARRLSPPAAGLGLSLCLGSE